MAASPRTPACEDCAPPILVLDALRAGLVTVDESGNVGSCNPHGAELLRRRVDEIVGAPIALLLAPLHELRERASGGDRGELMVRNGEGAQAVLGYTLSALEGGSTVVLFQELSGELAVRRERDRLQQLAAVGEVLPSVVHELRSPLAAVSNMLEVLAEGAGGELQQELRGVLSEVHRISFGLQRVGGLGRSAHSDQCDAIDEAIGETVRVLQPTAARKGVELVDGLPTLPLLSLDRAVIKGVVYNLVRNAIDACGPGDRIRVGASLVGSSFEVRVSDTGRGMTRQVLERCREVFFTTKESGAGVGLAICRQSVERAGGTLQLESEPGRGTTVTVCIPLRKLCD